MYFAIHPKAKALGLSCERFVNNYSLKNQNKRSIVVSVRLVQTYGK